MCLLKTILLQYFKEEEKMITSDFIKYAMQAVLEDVTFYLGESSTKSHTELGEMKINYYDFNGTPQKNTSTISGMTGTWETKAPARYCQEPSEGQTFTVSCVNAQGNGKILCSIPFQGSATLTKGYQIKINPYVAQKRGIQVTFSGENTNTNN